MSTTTGGNLSLKKPELTDNIEQTVGIDLPDNFQTIDDTFTNLDNTVNEHLADGVHQKVDVTNTDDATSITDAPLKSAGGLSVAKSIYVGDAVKSGINGGLSWQSGYKGQSQVFSFSRSEIPDSNISDGEQLRIRFKANSDRRGVLLRIVFVSGSTASNTLHDFIDKEFAFIITNEQTVSIFESNTRLCHGLANEDVKVSAVGFENMFDVIIEHSSLDTLLRNTWSLTIETMHVNEELTLIEIVKENIP